MKCSHVRRLLSAYRDGALPDRGRWPWASANADASPRRLVERHLETCETCRDELSRLRNTLGTIAILPVIDPARDFHKRLLERVMLLEEARQAGLFPPASVDAPHAGKDVPHARELPARRLVDDIAEVTTLDRARARRRAWGMTAAAMVAIAGIVIATSSLTSYVRDRAQECKDDWVHVDSDQLPNHAVADAPPPVAADPDLAYLLANHNRRLARLLAHARAATGSDPRVALDEAAILASALQDADLPAAEAAIDRRLRDRDYRDEGEVHEYLDRAGAFADQVGRTVAIAAPGWEAVAVAHAGGYAPQPAPSTVKIAQRLRKTSERARMFDAYPPVSLPQLAFVRDLPAALSILWIPTQAQPLGPSGQRAPAQYNAPNATGGDRSAGRPIGQSGSTPRTPPHRGQPLREPGFLPLGLDALAGKHDPLPNIETLRALDRYFTIGAPPAGVRYVNALRALDAGEFERAADLFGDYLRGSNPGAGTKPIPCRALAGLYRADALRRSGRFDTALPTLCVLAEGGALTALLDPVDAYVLLGSVHDEVRGVIGTVLPGVAGRIESSVPRVTTGGVLTNWVDDNAAASYRSVTAAGRPSYFGPAHLEVVNARRPVGGFECSPQLTTHLFRLGSLEAELLDVVRSAPRYDTLVLLDTRPTAPAGLRIRYALDSPQLPDWVSDSVQHSQPADGRREGGDARVQAHADGVEQNVVVERSVGGSTDGYWGEFKYRIEMRVDSRQDTLYLLLLFASEGPENALPPEGMPDTWQIRLLPPMRDSGLWPYGPWDRDRDVDVEAPGDGGGQSIGRFDPDGPCEPGVAAPATDAWLASGASLAWVADSSASSVGVGAGANPAFRSARRRYEVTQLRLQVETLKQVMRAHRDIEDARSDIERRAASVRLVGLAEELRILLEVRGR